MSGREERARARAIVVATGEFRLSCDPDSYLVSYALGSCIAVGFYDPTIRTGAVLRFMLPDSGMDPAAAAADPALFADTGIPLAIETLKRAGSSSAGLRVRLAGGAQMAASSPPLGKRNYLAARKVLWKCGLIIEGETVGGMSARHLGLTLDAGQFWVRTLENW